MARRRKNAYIFAPEQSPKSPRGFFTGLLILILLAAALLTAYNFVLGRQVKVETQKVSVMGMDKNLEGFTILHISDLHGARLGDKQETLRKALEGKSYQAVCLTGDMVGASGDVEAFMELLNVLDHSVPVFLIAGDSDPAPIQFSAHGSAGVYADFIQAAVDKGVIYLDAPYQMTLTKDTSVWFVPEYQYSLDAASMAAAYQNQWNQVLQNGLQDTADGAAAIRACQYQLDAIQRLQAAQKNMKAGQLQIALSHHPLEIEYIRTMFAWSGKETVMSLRNASLVLSGHYAGGQWRLPGLGAVYIPDLGWFPEELKYVGMNRINSVNQYISPGLGASDFYPFPGRFLNPPAVTLITLTAKPV